MDAWRLDEWNALPDVCFIAGCDNDDIDQRGPVILRDRSMHKACSEHWEPIFRVLGEQALGARRRPVRTRLTDRQMPAICLFPDPA